MKGWQWDHTSGQPITLNKDLPVPTIRPGSVLIKMESAVLVSGHKSIFSGEHPLPPFIQPPKGAFIPGSNGVGIITEIGPDVVHLKVGQRVMISPHFTSPELVESPAQILIGFSSLGNEKVQSYWREGTLAEYALMPVSVVTPVEGLPSNLDAVQIATLSRYTVPYGGLQRGRLAAGETLIVIGASGTLGSAAVFVALAMGATRVVAAGRNKASLDAVVAAAGNRVVSVVLTGDVTADTAALRAASNGGADIAYDIVGRATDSNATLSALKSLKRNGRLVVMGSMFASFPVPYMEMVLNNLEIIGHYMYPVDTPAKILKLAQGGLLNISAIKTIPIPMDKLREGLEQATKIKPVECCVLQYNK